MHPRVPSRSAGAGPRRAHSGPGNSQYPPPVPSQPLLVRPAGRTPRSLGGEVGEVECHPRTLAILSTRAQLSKTTLYGSFSHHNKSSKHLSLRGAGSDGAISIVDKDCFAALAMTPSPYARRWRFFPIVLSQLQTKNGATLLTGPKNGGTGGLPPADLHQTESSPCPARSPWCIPSRQNLSCASRRARLLPG